MDLHSSNPYSRVSNIPVPCLVGGLAHRDSGAPAPSTMFHHPLRASTGKGERVTWEFSGTSLGRCTAHPLRPHQQLNHLVMCPHLTNCNSPRIKRSWCLWIHSGLWFVFYPGVGLAPHPSTMTGFAALHWLWLFYHSQWRDHSELISIL